MNSEYSMIPMFFTRSAGDIVAYDFLLVKMYRKVSNSEDRTKKEPCWGIPMVSA